MTSIPMIPYPVPAIASNLASLDVVVRSLTRNQRKPIVTNARARAGAKALPGSDPVNAEPRRRGPRCAALPDKRREAFSLPSPSRGSPVSIR